MSYFAQLDENDVVQQVISISNDVLNEPMFTFPDTEPLGRAFIANTLGLPGEWRQTSYNGSFRGCYAGIGYRYDRDVDEFVSPMSEVENG
jgi:hypothetical protein